MDGVVNIWDLAAKDSENAHARVSEDNGELRDDGIAPELLFQHSGHDAGISDFSWNLMDRNLLCSVDDAGWLQMWQPQCSFDRVDHLVGEASGDPAEAPPQKRPRHSSDEPSSSRTSNHGSS
jgi:hypothetical protein